MKKLLSLTFALSLMAMGQTGTEQTRSTVYGYFADGQAAGSITPAKMRNFVASALFGASALTAEGAVPFVTSTAGTLSQDSTNLLFNNTTKVFTIKYPKLLSGTEGTCDASTQFTIVAVAGGAGVASTVRICTKDATDTYAWRSIL